MEKVNYQNKDISKRKKIMTGAAKVTACVALSGLIAGSLGLRLASLECAANHSVDTMCPIAKLDTLLFGEDAGMQHQAEDIARYNRIYEGHEEYTQGVTYMPAGSYVVPEGYELRTDEDGQVYGYKEVPVITTTYINEFGEEQNAYSLPVGGVIGKDKDGNMYGYQKVVPICLENGTIYYTVVNEYEDMIMMQDASWTYDDGEYLKNSEDVQILKKTR